LNRRELPLKARIDQAVKQLPAPILDDIKASSAYRELVLKLTLDDALRVLGGE
jgi:hypothetical protein